MENLDFRSCVIHPEASFKGADLRGSRGLSLCSAEQLISAQILSTDTIVVNTGTTIQLLGSPYPLCKPAQFLNSVLISGASPNQSSRQQRAYRYLYWRVWLHAILICRA